MAWVVTGQGTNSNTSGATLALAVAATIAAGSLVVVGITERTTGSGNGTMTDDAGNTYTRRVSSNLNAVAASGRGHVFDSVLTTQLNAGASITYTKAVSGSRSAIAVLSATGNHATPIDTAVTATATGSSTTPSVTSGTPAEANELFVGVCCADGLASFTVDVGNGWAAPPAFVASGTGAAEGAVGGGNQVNAGVGTKTHAPTLGTSRPWADFIVGYKIAASDTLFAQSVM